MAKLNYLNDVINKAKLAKNFLDDIFEIAQEDIMSVPVEITDKNFKEEVLESETPVLVDFWAAWCGPCKMIAPVVEEIANDYDGKIKVGKVDVDRNQYAAAQFGIRSIPTLLVFKNGEVVDQIVGAVPKPMITQKLDKVL